MNVLSRLFGARGDSPVVVREVDSLLVAMNEELNAAPESERPGLERAIDLVTALADRDDQTVLAAWVQVQLGESQPGSGSEVESVRRLRQLHPDMSLLQATRLVRLATRPA